MFQEIRGVLSTRFKHHRDPGFQAYVLPLCQPLIEAIGYRMAYDAAVEEGVDKTILDMFVASVVREDRAWFSEVGGISRVEQMDLERMRWRSSFPASMIFSRRSTSKNIAQRPLYRTRNGENMFKACQRSLQTPIFQPYNRHRN